MNLGATLFLTGSIAVLVALNRYSAIEIEAFIGEHVKDIGIGLLALAIVTMWKAALVQRWAFYVALAGAAYLVLQHRDAIIAIVEGMKML
ncbi:MAG: hypothetical protein U0350_36455 [Caldilineaceae bacterium]